MNIKKQLGLIVAMILLHANSFGQSNELGSEKIRVAEKSAETYFDLMITTASTNLNYGSSNSALSDYKESVKGIHAGVSFQAGITSKFSLVSELYYIRKGGELTANNPLTTQKTILRLNAFELPVLARFHFGKFYMNAGPSIAYNFSGTRKIEDVSTSISFKNSTDAFNRLDAGVQIGGGYMFPIKQKRLALDIRYCYGLTNISSDKEMFNRGLIISVHFSKPWKTNPLRKNRTI
ncbi:MAG TPA: porin family protein [Prolixibacteraceae bacterium]|nr:porin family protein [Prolixibacteraceae bacterium]